ncbi:hypothetical protein Taro_033773 [Colocasia esculenta]|uniref:Uncharacterized protein n=1 Tax=Colocasia esculenta TaxID=4460 RepID=A0A843W5N5_COLES|nr:hypothetical protein [Colocasia esculenta]
MVSFSPHLKARAQGPKQGEKEELQGKGKGSMASPNSKVQAASSSLLLVISHPTGRGEEKEVVAIVVTVAAGNDNSSTDPCKWQVPDREQPCPIF